MIDFCQIKKNKVIIIILIHLQEPALKVLKPNPTEIKATCTSQIPASTASLPTLSLQLSVPTPDEFVGHVTQNVMSHVTQNVTSLINCKTESKSLIGGDEYSPSVCLPYNIPASIDNSKHDPLPLSSAPVEKESNDTSFHSFTPSNSSTSVSCSKENSDMIGNVVSNDLLVSGLVKDEDSKCRETNNNINHKNENHNKLPDDKTLSQTYHHIFSVNTPPEDIVQSPVDSLTGNIPPIRPSDGLVQGNIAKIQQNDVSVSHQPTTPPTTPNSTQQIALPTPCSPFLHQSDHQSDY